MDVRMDIDIEKIQNYWPFAAKIANLLKTIV